MTARDSLRLVNLGIVMLAFACSSTGSTVQKQEPDIATEVGDASVATEIVDSIPAEVRQEVELVELLPDDSPDAAGPACAPGEGCFLDPCDENAACQSGWCVDYMGEGVCTVPCQEECPAGWSCQQVGSGPDVTYVCIANHANLCRPCGSGDNCKSPGGAEDVCVSYGAEGSFCGGVCADDEDCPWGFSCLDAVTVDGMETKQCVADAGVCPCTKKSIALSLWTPCTRANEHGECQGQRVCTVDGLSLCDAIEPSSETCNGADDDCDGQADEPQEADGEYVSLCFDGNPCTKDQCNGESGCSNTLLDEGECMDGDACTVGDHCEAGVCVGLPVACDDDDPCTEDSCDGLGGCKTTFNKASCDDADPCTVADSCAEGACVGVSIPCDCQADADCSQLEDGDQCNGTLFCDKGDWPYVCAVKPGSVILCPLPPAGPSAVCQAPACDPLTGECSLVPDHEGFACSDGSACTAGEHCVAGACEGAVDLSCLDDNPCTDDTCDPAVGCIHTANAAPCSDGNVCTTLDKCNATVCVGGPALVCDDGSVCTGTETCDPMLGCKAGKPLVCGDGNACNGLETCDPVKGCQSGAVLACDDKNLCTDDTCDPIAGCVHQPNSKACDDGNACTTGDKCSGGSCVAGEATGCDDGNLCTTDSCTPSKGCVHMLNTVPCDDGDLCTTGDHCAMGVCISSAKLTCNDGNPCTADSCAPGAGCQFVPTIAACDDGNACTSGDACSKGQCLGPNVVSCDDDNVCTKDFCSPLTGCGHSPLPGPCEDGTECSVGDTCQNGVCVAGPPLACDDKNSCTVDVCDPKLGCVYKAFVGGCDDANPCTIGDVCQGTVCTPGLPKDCDDDNVCTTDACDPVKLCVNAPKAGACDDGNACTTGESCQTGTCKGGAPVDCDDGKPCTTDSCDPAIGCSHVDFVPCCGNSILEAGEECDDGNVVGGDGCEPDCKQFTAVSVTFTNCGQTGPSGPIQSQCNSTYSGNPFLNGKVTVTAGIQYWTVPFTGTYRIEAFGAQGGCNGGNGARMRGDFVLAQGTQLKILVGQQGSAAPAAVGNGGGGGTYVAKADNTPVIAAGGGGGTGHNCYNDYDMSGVTGIDGIKGKYETAGLGGVNGQGGGYGLTTEGVPNAGGGGGFYGDGGSIGHANGGKAFVNGGVGGSTTGGFGGGGGSDQFIYGCGSSPHGGSGGGGYSGGGGGATNCNGPGGGGGSYNNGANQSNSAGANSGHGKVTINRL